MGLRSTALERGLKQAQKRLQAFGSSVQSIGSQMVRIGGMAAIPFAASAKVFAGFEQQMARVKAISGATEGEFERLEARAKELGATTAFSAAQAAEAMGNFALAGFDVETMLKAVGPTLDLAAAGQIEIAEAADIAAKIMAGMGIAADDLGNTMDLLTKAMTTANTDILMLGEAFKYVGPIAKTAGISMEEITAGIQGLSNAGMQGEQAGTILRGMILALTAPSAEASDTLRKLGVRVKDVRGNFRGLTPIIADFQRGMAGMGSAQQLESLGTIFGARQAAGASELISQGAQQLRDATQALGDSGGTAARIAATQMDTLTGSALIVLSALQGLAIEIGEALTPAIRKVATRFIEAINAVTTFAAENKNLVMIVAGGAAALVAGGAALFTLGIAAKIAAVSLGGIASVIGLILNPIGLVIAAVVGLTAAFVTMTETGNAAFESVKETAIAAFGGIADALKGGNIALAAKILWLSLRVEWQKGIVYLNDLTFGFIGSFRKAFDDVQFAIAESIIKIVAFFERSIARMIALVGGLANAAKALVTGGDVGAAIDQIGVNADARTGAIDQREADSLAALRDQQSFANANRGTVDSELERLQGELSAALAEAAELAKPKIAEELQDAAGDDPAKKPTLPLPAALDESLGETSKRTVDTKGSFSAAALRSLGTGDSVADRTAEATEKTADELAKLNDKARQGRLVFTE